MHVWVGDSGNKTVEGSKGANRNGAQENGARRQQGEDKLYMQR